METQSDLETLVINVIRRQFGASDKAIAPSTRLDDLSADSLARVELTLVFEETFDIEIPDGEADTIRTVRDAVTAIDKHVRAQASG
jgi:acyl carrier protein